MSEDIPSYKFDIDKAQESGLKDNRSQKRIVMCADDYGMNPGVNNGILGLAQQSRLSATSLLVDAPNVKDNIPELINSGLQLGLHLNLTESFGQHGVCLPLKKIIRDAYLRRLSLQALRETIRHQLEQFELITGFSPDYVDGHQHVHQLPIVRDALLAELENLPKKPWIRNTSMRKCKNQSWKTNFKAAVITALGSSGLQRRAKLLSYQQNSGFVGVYDFQGGVKAYESNLRIWLAACHDGDVLMCHPANGAGNNDALARQRQAEYDVLSGALFGHLLARNNMLITTSQDR